MKPATFVHYIVQHQTEIMRGWISGAAFEGFVQVVFDQIIRDHLSSKVAAFLDDQNATFLGQQTGKHGIVDQPPQAQVGYADWSRMREIKYDNSKKISDLYVRNERFVQNDALDPSSYVSKGTYYWIELKVESPGTAGYQDFGGKSPTQALSEDVTKLAGQKLIDAAQTGSNHIQRCRYWYVMLAFSNDRRGWIKSLTGATWTVAVEFMHPMGPMVVCLMEV